VHTRPIVEARVFARYSNGQFVAVPALSRLRRDTAKVIGIPTAAGGFHASASERSRPIRIWLHQACGVDVGARAPLVFMPAVGDGVAPCAQ